ncbi:MAG: TaqI-like C-terminal specificity domain-containing protein, partial [Acidimicrobiia bacterium]
RYHPQIVLKSLFYEAALRLLGGSGFLAFITPVTWLTIPSAKSLRRFVLEGYALFEICWMSEQAFESASVNTVISIIGKTVPSTTRVKIFNLLTEFPTHPAIRRECPQKQFVNAGHYISIFSYSEENSILEKIGRVSRPLGESARPCSGYNPYEVGAGKAPGGGPHTEKTVRDKPYHSTIKRGNHWKPEIIGRDLRRYYVRVSGDRWVKYGPWLAAPRDPENFKGTRILVQEITGGKEMRLVAAYCEDELYHSRDVIPIKLEKSNPNPFYLLAVVNSRLLSWYHQKLNPKAQKGLFPKVLVSDLKNLPIFPAGEDQQHPIAKLAREVVDAKRQDPNADTKPLEREIDRRVYALYDLTLDEIRIVEESAFDTPHRSQRRPKARRSTSGSCR